MSILIGDTLKELPGTKQKGTKWSALRKAIKALPANEWLPVTCESTAELRRLRTGIRSHASLEPMPSLTTKRRGLTVYIKLRLPLAAI
jgi:hypothetical protein